MFHHWMELLPELQNVVRTEGLGKEDRLSRAMLSLTCKKEHAQWHSELFDDCAHAWFEDACYEGYMTLAQWVFYKVANAYEKRMMYYDEAVEQGHYDLAEWAHKAGISIRTTGPLHMAQNGNLDALKWLAAHGHRFQDPLLRAAKNNLEMIRWLVEDHRLQPFDYLLEDLLEEEPFSEEIATYYMNYNLRPHVVAFLGAGIAAHWQVLDFLERTCPEDYAYAVRNYPMIRICHRQRLVLTPGQRIALDTGLIIEDEKSSSESDEMYEWGGTVY